MLVGMTWSAALHVLKTVIGWYLVIYLPLGILCYVKAYTNFVHHRASGIPFEIMTIYDTHPAESRNLYWSWFWPPWKLQAGYLRNVAHTAVPAGDLHRAGVSLEPVVWGDSVEDKSAVAWGYFDIQYFEGFTWLEGQPVSGKSQLTLIGTNANERLGFVTERWDSTQQRMVLPNVTISSETVHVYNANEVWYFFTSTTCTDVSLQDNPELAAIAEETAKQPGGFDTFPAGTFPQALAPEDDPRIMAALNEKVNKAAQWQAGMQSRSLLFQSIEWIDFRYAGFRTLHDNFVAIVLWSTFLYIPTLPIMYLLFTPLIISPHWLVVPLAFLYPLALLLLLWQCVRRFISRDRLGTLIVLVGVNLFILLFSSPTTQHCCCCCGDVLCKDS